MKDFEAVGTVEVMLVTHENNLAATFPVRRPIGNHDGVWFFPQNDLARTKRFTSQLPINIRQDGSHLHHPRLRVRRRADPVQLAFHFMATSIGLKANRLPNSKLIHVLQWNIECEPHLAGVRDFKQNASRVNNFTRSNMPLRDEAFDRRNDRN